MRMGILQESLMLIDSNNPDPAGWFVRIRLAKDASRGTLVLHYKNAEAPRAIALDPNELEVEAFSDPNVAADVTATDDNPYEYTSTPCYQHKTK